VAIGLGAIMWFAHGEKPTRENLQRITIGVAEHLGERLLGLGEEKPDRDTLRKRITQALKDLPDQLHFGAKSARVDEESPSGLDS
jgi:hypothetical protein